MPEQGPKPEKVPEREWVQVPWAVQPPLIDAIIAWLQSAHPDDCSRQEMAAHIAALTQNSEISCCRLHQVDVANSIGRLSNRLGWTATNEEGLRQDVLGFLLRQQAYIQRRQGNQFTHRDLSLLTGDAGVAIRAKYLSHLTR